MNTRFETLIQLICLCGYVCIDYEKKNGFFLSSECSMPNNLLNIYYTINVTYSVSSIQRIN